MKMLISIINASPSLPEALLLNSNTCTFAVLFPQKALAKLKKIPDAIKAIMERLEPELKQIVKRSTTQIADHAYQRGESLAQESQPRYAVGSVDESGIR